MRSQSALLGEVRVSPIFLLPVPDRKPRTECGNQPVASISSLEVVPPGRLSRSRILAVLLPLRATLGLAANSGLVRLWGAFLAGEAWRADLALAGATWARRGATRAFFFGFLPVAVAVGVPFSSGINVVICYFSFAVGVAVTTSITRVRLKCKLNLHRLFDEWDVSLGFPLACGAKLSVHGPVDDGHREEHTFMNTAVLREIESLRRAGVTDLRNKYQEVFQEQTRSKHREHLFRRIAWRLQALAEGDLSQRARARAHQIAQDSDLRINAPREFFTMGGERLQTTGDRNRREEDRRLALAGGCLAPGSEGE